MKNVITLSALIGILTSAILGCDIDSEEEVRDLGPVQFVSADPPSGSTLLSHATITVSFNGIPTELIVSQGVVSRSDQIRRTVTISGPFTVGELTLTMKWKDGGAHTLFYTVEPVPVKLVSVDPPDGSLLVPDGQVTVSFDGEPRNLSVTPGKISVSGRIATIPGPFPRGELNLEMKWDTGTHTLTYTIEFAAPEGMSVIPEGEFEMGSDAVAANDDEHPVHTVYVDAFYMDKHETTVGEYREFVQKTGHRAPDWNKVSRYSPNDQSPIVFVSWHDAMTYAKWKGKRLPTEAEWEKAARGGVPGQSYPWGNTAPDGTQCNFADKNIAHFWWADKAVDDGYTHTAPVRSYPDNAYGLHDMAGNVWEWCLDEYDSGFYAISSGTNPFSEVDTIEVIIDTFSSVQTPRVLRGGSWLVNSQLVRNAVRFRLDPSSTNNSIGFRCAKDLPF